MVLNRLDQGARIDHFLLNSAKYTTWPEFEGKIVNYRRATQATQQPASSSQGPVAMEIGAL
eukprot:4008685-Prorocentrum_lima.AAC.1